MLISLFLQFELLLRRHLRQDLPESALARGELAQHQQDAHGHEDQAEHHAQNAEGERDGVPKN